MRILMVLVTLLWVLFTCCSIVTGELTAKPSSEYHVPHEDTLETQHTITVEGESFSYLSRAGFIPLLDTEDNVLAQVFYVAYEKEGEGVEKRPLTFLYNGARWVTGLWF